MADIIQLLPESIANQIAAGEVIQRPASVVKELIENAVDAGSTEIQLIVKEAGKSLIQVVDNGCGMSATDARMSFERHATSKIRQSADLFAIRTMGFRGEALASIAAVAQVEMRTRKQADELGSKIVIEDSEVKSQEPCQCAAGTSISVKNLFYNVPARRNFLKSHPVEMRHIVDEFLRIAIANPDIFFVLHHNNNEVYHLPSGNLRQRLVHLFGQAANKKLVPVSQDTEVCRLDGFVGKPEFSKKTRGEQYFFVNSRFIKSGYLNHAVTSAYEDLLPKDSYPLYVIFIEVDPASIDINVHPTKQEIKFEDEQLIYNYLRVAVRHSLGQYSITPTIDFDQESNFAIQTQARSDINREKTINTVLSAGGGQRDTEKSYKDQGMAPSEDRNLKYWQKLYEGLDEISPSDEESDGFGAVTLESSWSSESDQDVHAAPAYQARKEPYQIHQSYIVSQIKSGFILIDQQAAHERILYEQFLSILDQQSASTQHQLFPKTIELSANDALYLESMLDEINLLGFDIQPFGANTFVINGLPAEMAGKKDEVALIEMMLEQYKINQELRLTVKENIARAMAISSAIKRGQMLSTVEMQSLIDRLFACAMPYRSPGGRNCFLTYDLEELNKQFDQ
ncbi:MAG TPA: DNA mismatch repair endonuclease MutL [Saprospiraceae bacterium]|nr:DNA mismatch repair endonuclease MutL [Saprospiraceae bacterium]HMQ82035.1 DNA mismatch repair endonuclease MutL [Saprospiraceae bacterium]